MSTADTPSSPATPLIADLIAALPDGGDWRVMIAKNLSAQRQVALLKHELLQEAALEFAQTGVYTPPDLDSVTYVPQSVPAGD